MKNEIRIQNSEVKKLIIYKLNSLQNGNKKLFEIHPMTKSSQRMKNGEINLLIYKILNFEFQF